MLPFQVFLLAVHRKYPLNNLKIYISKIVPKYFGDGNEANSLKKYNIG